MSFATPAWAGEEVLYQPAPSWVEEATLEEGARGEGAPLLIADWQYWMEDGVVTSYFDSATRIDNPQSLMEVGTISFDWLPDKGDLSVHRVQILRDGTTIDVLGDGTEFDILRREQGLEQRLLDGQLTATLAVPGLQVGDILRVTHSKTVDDQALGDEMQVLQYLPADPWQVGFARAVVSWPSDEEVFWRVEDHAGVTAPKTDDGVSRIAVTLPLAEKPDMPADAPSRYHRPAILRLGTYADWAELSRTMEPHFAKAAQIDGDGAIARQAKQIMAKTKDPLHRAALATQLVQDEVSYLLNGLDGGNYLPQSAQETWEKRYGDCKAKSVLLNALLTQMGITSQTVLVQTRGGDSVAELLPMPGNFDHMIVRAQIDGQDYWLDGTSAATRINNIDWVPAFHYALPLTAEGADLMPIAQRDQTQPNLVMDLVADYSAGVDLPTLYTVNMRFYGPQGAGFRKLADEDNEEVARNFGRQVANGQGGGVVSSVEIEYNEEEAFGILRVTGVTSSDFEWTDGRLVMDANMRPDASFDASRAKPEWRDIPVATQGTSRNLMKGKLVLPDDVAGFLYEGPETYDMTFGNTRMIAANRLDGTDFVGEVDVTQTLGEVTPAQLPEAKRTVRKLTSQKSRLVAPEDVVWRWERSAQDLERRSRPIVQAYQAAIDFAEDDDFGPLQERAGFFHDTYRFQEALSDLNTLVEKDTSSWVLHWRSNVLHSLGQTQDALDDLQRAYDLEPDNEIALVLAERLAYAGRIDEAHDLLADLPVSDEESSYYASILSIVTGLSGDVAGGLDIMADAVAEKPQNEAALNSDCWYRGLFAVGLEDALDICTRAIERASNSAPMLDSRAMVHYRKGNHDEALADLNSALDLSPGLAASHFLRGVILLAQGDNARAGGHRHRIAHLAGIRGLLQAPRHHRRLSVRSSPWHAATHACRARRSRGRVQ